jgi:formate--tetrahydrofolate ligase
MKTSLDIARDVQMRPIAELAAELGLHEDEYDLYGRYKLKVRRRVLERLADAPNGREIVGYGHDSHAAWARARRRQPSAWPRVSEPHRRQGRAHHSPASLGPVFGLKGGAAGGGYSQVLPMEDINLHLTGDMHAVAAAHNLAAAFLDNHLFRGNALNIDPATIRWPRVIDVNDRALRRVMLGLGEAKDVRESEWHITAASE